MSRQEGELVYRRMRAPAAHGSAFIDPPWSEMAFPKSFDDDFPILDTTRNALAPRARAALLAAAQINCGASTESVDADQPLILSGHQPDLFHPGVWFKNFALAALAQRFGARAVNLEIDNDLCRSTSIRCPQREREANAGEASGYSVVPIAFDEMDEPIPFEQRAVADEALFASFGERVARQLEPVVSDPIVEPLWPLVVEQYGRTGRLGSAIAGGRRQFERRLGVANLEAPLHSICDTDPFRRFLLHLLVSAAEFAAVHNECLHAYRRVNRIRSRSHPAPALETRNGWVETPFWIWRREQPQRRRAFVSAGSGGNLIFGAPGELEIQLPDPTAEPASAVESLQAANDDGYRIRTRALITTMYARLMLSDLFLHGIGGAKYDQLTDELMRRFWRVPPPPFITLTATFQLPLPLHGVSLSEVRDVDAKLRSLRFHPELHLGDKEAENARSLMDEKERLLAQSPPRGAGKPRRDRLDEINRALQPMLLEQYDLARQRRSLLIARHREDRLLGSREFSFCLHGLETLPRRLLDLCAKPS